MTQQDKARAYDEALERVTNLENTTPEENALIEYIFPKLVESEDERIRKEIKEFIFKRADRGDLIEKRKKWIAYLEKQKEMPTNEEMLRTLRAEYEKGVADTIAKYEQKEQKPIFRVGDNIIAKDGTCIPKEPFYIERVEDDCYWDGDSSILISNQDEFQLIKQKPAESNNCPENDKYIRYGLKIILEHWNNLPDYLLDENKMCANLYNFLKSCLTPEQEMRSKIISRATSEKQVVLVSESDGNAEIGWDTRSLEDAKNLLEYGISFINKQLGVKPAEWSEEEIGHVYTLASYIKSEGYEDDGEFLEGVANKLKRLHPQPKQEWSEKDKEMIEDIIDLLDPNLAASDFHEIENWLKSLPERFNLQPKQEWSEDYREEDIQTRFAFYTYKDDPSVLYLSNVFVEEASRNHGFGTRTLKAAEKAAEAIGATTICLKVKQDSPANAWYRKRGYGYVVFEDGYDWLEKNLEYMKPNNPVEWSKEDEKCIKDIINCLEYLEREDTERQYNGDRSVNPGRYADMIAILKSLPERFNLQPKQEWSDEDSDMICEIIDHCITIPYIGGTLRLSDERKKELKTFVKSLRPVKQEWSEEDEDYLTDMKCAIYDYFDEGYAEELYGWLKSLPERFSLQPKQEWSDEDEKMIDHLIEALPMWATGRIAMLPSQADEYVKRLKSLRPVKQEWSEEDEEHLDSIIESYKELLKDYSANHGVDYIPYNTPAAARTVLNDIKFLKSLRSQDQNRKIV